VLRISTQPKLLSRPVNLSRPSTLCGAGLNILWCRC
jgi:hypothetical protein